MIKKKKRNLILIIGLIIVVLILMKKGTIPNLGLLNQSIFLMGSYYGCSDTDITTEYPTGDNPGTRGRATDIDSATSPYDYCTGVILTEYFCYITGYVGTVTHDCGSGYCDPFGDFGCYDNDVYEERICYLQGCTTGHCWTDAYLDYGSKILDCQIAHPDGECYHGTCRYPAGCTDPVADDGQYACRSALDNVYKCVDGTWDKQDDCEDYSGYDKPCLRTVVRDTENEAMADCTVLVCSPDCSCAVNTCIGGTCSDGCGGVCGGTKDCTPEEETFELSFTIIGDGVYTGERANCPVGWEDTPLGCRWYVTLTKGIISTPTIAWDAALQTGSAVGASYVGSPSSNRNLRTLVKSAYITASGTEIRVLLSNTLGTEGTNMQIGKMSICERSGTSDDCVPGTLVHLAESWWIPIYGEDWTDWTIFNLDENKDYFISVHHPDKSGVDFWAGEGTYVSSSSTDMSQTEEWAATMNGWIMGTHKIEVR